MWDWWGFQSLGISDLAIPDHSAACKTQTLIYRLQHPRCDLLCLVFVNDLSHLVPYTKIGTKRLVLPWQSRPITLNSQSNHCIQLLLFVEIADDSIQWPLRARVPCMFSSNLGARIPAKHGVNVFCAVPCRVDVLYSISYAYCTNIYTDLQDNSWQKRVQTKSNIGGGLCL
jgi:hypothetical protein